MKLSEELKCKEFIRKKKKIIRISKNAMNHSKTNLWKFISRIDHFDWFWLGRRGKGIVQTAMKNTIKHPVYNIYRKYWRHGDSAGKSIAWRCVRGEFILLPLALLRRVYIYRALLCTTLNDVPTPGGYTIIRPRVCV